MVKGHRLVLKAGYIYHGKHHDKLGGYTDLTESLDKTAPEITRAAGSLLRPELPGWFHKVPPALWQGMEKKEKEKKNAIYYYFNFHVSASLEYSIIYDDIKLYLITIFLITVFIKLSAVMCKLSYVTFHNPMETINQ